MTFFTLSVLPVTLFFMGLLGVLFRRNLLVILMSLELMLNSVSFLLVIYRSVRPDAVGPAFVLLLLGLAAAEVAIGLALAVNLVRLKGTPDVDAMQILKG